MTEPRCRPAGEFHPCAKDDRRDRLAQHRVGGHLALGEGGEVRKPGHVAFRSVEQGKLEVAQGLDQRGAAAPGTAVALLRGGGRGR